MCLAALSLPAEAAPGPSCFARALPGEFRGERLNDLKFLLGFVFDAASAHLALPVGSIIDHTSGLRQGPGWPEPLERPARQRGRTAHRKTAAGAEPRLRPGPAPGRPLG